MHDLCCVNPNEMFFPELRAITRHFKANAEGVFAVKNMSEKIFEDGRQVGREEGRQVGREEGRQEGREEGRQEGRQEGRREMIREIVAHMQGLGKTLEEIAQSLALPQDEVRALADQARGA